MRMWVGRKEPMTNRGFATMWLVLGLSFLVFLTTQIRGCKESGEGSVALLAHTKEQLEVCQKDRVDSEAGRKWWRRDAGVCKAQLATAQKWHVLYNTCQANIHRQRKGKPLKPIQAAGAEAAE